MAMVVVTSPMPARACPVCGICLNMVSAMGLDGLPPPPAVGDLTLCDHCAVPLVFTEGGGLGIAPAGLVDRLAEPLRTLFLATLAHLAEGRARH